MTIRVLLVDDSLFIRVMIKKIIDADPRFEVVGEAKDGQTALSLLDEVRPQVITMDVNMPGMDGVTCVAAIMQRRPTPVVMLSAHTSEGARVTLDALAAGAVDFLEKPSGEISTDLPAIGSLLLDKLATAARASVRRPAIPGAPVPRVSEPRAHADATKRLVVLGASTGGPSALLEVLPRLPRSTPLGLVVVQHMPAGFTTALAERLDAQCAIAVYEARDGMRPRAGMAVVAPGDRHLEIDAAGTFRVSEGAPVNNCRPSVDVTMRSVARYAGRRAAGVLMTGMGRDGAEGMQAIREAGGATFAQDAESSVIHAMPRAAIQLGVVDEVVALDAIAERLVALGES